ncbi:MAG: hypothetical protein A2051_13035 [Desulfovibrionales bacterium GWA2_65_9]|nr:MAG: hypothetical protein A2051_13035 [Desulfovibrionales bacterium GWA2_65_9]
MCRDGDVPGALYFVDSGSVNSIRQLAGGSSRRLAQFRTGAMVGEMAFHSGEARTASIIAVADSRVHTMRREALEGMRAAHPELVTCLGHMAIRNIAHSLTRANTLITTLG